VRARQHCRTVRFYGRKFVACKECGRRTYSFAHVLHGDDSGARFCERCCPACSPGALEYQAGHQERMAEIEGEQEGARQLAAEEIQIWQPTAA